MQIAHAQPPTTAVEELDDPHVGHDLSETY